MVLTKSEKKEYEAIKRVIKGTPIKAIRVGPANIKLVGNGNTVVRQLGGNVGLSAYTVALAKVTVWSKRKKQRF
jgi:hypothetical protein